MPRLGRGLVGPGCLQPWPDPRYESGSIGNIYISEQLFIYYVFTGIILHDAYVGGERKSDVHLLH